jgi:murein DD-endopeptidase MepM/ murein hydrolase activator NlpD
LVAFSFFARVRTIVGAFAAVASFMAANPALANSSATADIAAPLRAAQAAKHTELGNGDDEFRRLFASWQSLDKPGTQIARPSRRIGSVAIPSRMPVDGVRLTSDFGMRWHPVTGGRRAHKGVDLAGPIGTPVHATADGVVSRADWFSGYGLYVALEHGGDIESRYGHMSRLNVAAGQQVRKGDIIGFVGSTGRSTGPHLHYEVRIAGQAVNPIPYMQSGEVRVALANDNADSTGKGGE